MSELISGIGRVRGRLGEISAPALVVHSIEDRFVPVSSAGEIASRLAGPVEAMVIHGSGHAITADVKREQVAKTSRSFLRRHVGRTVTTPALTGVLAAAG
jgi:esterase/lipase